MIAAFVALVASGLTGLRLLADIVTAAVSDNDVDVLATAVARMYATTIT